VQPSEPRLLLPYYIIPEVAFYPLVDYLGFPIHLRVIAVLGVKSVPTNLNNSYQKVLMKLLSLSLTMVLGKLCNLKISLKNSSTTCAPLKSMAMEKKCANFVNLSTTTKIQSFPYVLGNSVMKSMDMLYHLCSGMGKGCSNPDG
jgi:hypothetical protein